MNQLIRLCLLSAALGVACACGVSPRAGAAAPKPGAVAWRAIGPGQFGAMFGIGISPHDSKVIVAGGDMGLAFMTRDGGQHWEMLGHSGEKEYGEAYRPNQFGDRPPMRLTHMVRSRDLHLIVPTCVAVDPFDPKTMAMGHLDVGLVISRDGGNWWEWAWHGILEGEKNNIPLTLGGEENAVVFDRADPARFFVLHSSGAFEGIDPTPERKP